jgi:3-dehydroquinate synthetase/catechol 2,3-dioxygenase-like lactoylglutathione lyase family enzyme
MSVTRVPVDTAGRPYEVLIGPGLIAAAGAHLAALRPDARVGIVADAHVDALHGPVLRAGLDAAGIGHATVVVTPGEASKSWAGIAAVCDGLLAARIERRDLVLALGGGVVGDLAGFAAGILRRGVDVVQLPTSLLAQVDSSVGGKTGINTPHGKNLIGVFQQPKLVLADTGVLDTLPSRELRAGYAEVVKYGLLGDAAFFAWLERHGAEVLSGGPARVEAVAASVRAKAAIVARDEFETGDRALLNLGHTFGHALEVSLLRAPGADRIAIGGARRAASDRRRPADADRTGPRRCVRRRRPDGGDPAGQEGRARRADLHPGARYRRGLRREGRRPRGDRGVPGRGGRAVTALGGVSGVDYVVLLCRDLPRAVAFYRDIMRFPIAVERENWVSFRVGATLLTLRPRGVWPICDDGALPPGVAAVQLAFRVEMAAIDTAHDALRAAGVTILRPPTDLPAWRHRTLFIRDAEDNILELYAEY